MKLTLLATLSLLALSGCSGRWNEKTCHETNFEDLGYQEGSTGGNSNAEQYNQACLKKKVQIHLSKYNSGYKRGLIAFCSSNKGINDGSAGKQMFPNCRSIKTYSQAHRKGLRSYCTTQKGVQDGFSMRPERILCTSFSNYTSGHAKGKKEYCSSDRGYDHGYKGLNQDARCAKYSRYKSGFAKGQRFYCSAENGTSIGKNGDKFPKKCSKAGGKFRRNFSKGRVYFLEKVLKEKRTAVTFERQNYERLRDDLQDSQFSLNRLPKYSKDPSVLDERERVERHITRLQAKRNQQRRVVEDLETQMYDIKGEISDLKSRY